MIEAVIALALVMILLAAIGSLVATSARGAAKLEQHAALMDTVRLIASAMPRNGEPLPPDLGGKIAGYRWQTRISPFDGKVSVVPDSRFIPHLIELRVRSPSGAIASFETVRLQSRDER